MENPLSPAGELALIDRELVQLDARRLQLLRRREWLVRVLAARPAAAAPARWPGWGPAAGAPPRETSAPGAQNVLLALGAVLLAVAALAFTLVSWGSMGIGGRSAVLTLLTVAALAVPAVLLRRGLGSTAESVAGVGLTLTVLDAYALYAVGMSGTDRTAYAAGAAAVLAALWAGYGLALRGLRLPLPAAVLTAQLVLPLAAVAAGAGAPGLGWALLVTAVLDAAPAAFGRRGALSGLAGVSGAVLGAGAALLALAESAGAATVAAALPASVLLAGVAAGCVAVAWRPAPWATGVAVAGGLALVAALGGLARPAVSGGWLVVVQLAVALPLLAAGVAAGLPAALRRGLAGAGALVAALAAVVALPLVAGALVAPAGVLGEVWAATTPEPVLPWTRSAAGPVLLVLLAVAAAGLERVTARPGPQQVTVVAVWAAAFVAPGVLGAPPAVALAAQVALTVAVPALGLRGAAGRAAAAFGCAAAGALSVSVAALDGRTATFAVFGVLGAAAAAVAAYGRAARPARAGAAVVSVGYATALLVALGALLELRPHHGALLVLVVPAVVAAAGPRLGPVRVAAEGAGAAAGLLAIGLAVGHRPTLALVLALAAVVCAGAAVRADRRVVGWAAGALFVAATWVRLAASGVAVPEAYTLPVTVPALVVGLLRRRRDAQASSWTAYGPGLAATLLPSLVAAWGDPHWLRPLLLGAAALAVTLAGAQRGLQAPLLLGGTVLVLVALHELAPYVVQVVDALPRWLPPALAGVLLLAVGATYEKRLRDARRLRQALSRMR
ncbi:SCO7613 C-terminal domain-containing membrane protein [Streptomyces sp. NPDC090022]|uniref:SCO7613 C-terminal domain-containing membrane protein n=1 Tax=Streptomyces sp. NPDC090022 TaxID=3365920 RepID=UPI003822F970